MLPCCTDFKSKCAKIKEVSSRVSMWLFACLRTRVHRQQVEVYAHTRLCMLHIGVHMYVLRAFVFGVHMFFFLATKAKKRRTYMYTEYRYSLISIAVLTWGN